MTCKYTTCPVCRTVKAAINARAQRVNPQVPPPRPPPEPSAERDLQMPPPEVAILIFS